MATVGRTPILVTRDGDGALRGMVNICRHRLHPVALADGSSRVLQCRYHGWSYKLDGALQNAPRCRDELVIDKASPDSSRLRFRRWALGSSPTWTSMRTLGRPCERLLHFVDQMLESSSVSRTASAPRRRLPATGSSSWKTPSSATTAHSSTRSLFAKAFKVNQGEYESQIHAHSNTQFGPAKAVPLDLPGGREPNGFQFLFLPPNSLIAIDDFAMYALGVRPTGPTTCEVAADMFVDEAMPAEALEDWVSLYFTQTVEEDVQAVERQQAGFSAGAVSHGRLLPDSENAIAASSRPGSGPAPTSEPTTLDRSIFSSAFQSQGGKRCSRRLHGRQMGPPRPQGALPVVKDLVETHEATLVVIHVDEIVVSHIAGGYKYLR